MRYAAFFRGINVGGKHIVKMADLRQLFADLGFENVRTYIQSGNAVFSTELDQGKLPGLIAGNFSARFGFESAVVLRSADDIDAILKALPFSQAEIARAEAADPKTTHLYVFLSGQAVDAAAIRALQAAYTGEDRLIAAKREVYLLCRHSILKSKLAAPLMKPDAAFTSRNLKTMRKLQSMLLESADL